MKDLWELAIGEMKLQTQEKKTGTERTMILCGSKGVGKTTLINAFLHKDDPVKPTIAIEYSFGYMNKGHEKEVGHVYELGGGTWLAKLLNSVVNSATVKSLVFVVMVDLTSPPSIWRLLDHLLATGKGSCDTAFESLDRNTQAELKSEVDSRFPEDHPDCAIKGLLKPFPVPLIIIGGKYDQFLSMEPEPRKQVCRGLRFFAHTFGATLTFYSNRQEQLLTRTNAVLSNGLFGSELPVRSPIFDPNKALYIPVGTDKFAEIGMPPVTDQGSVRSRASDPVSLWRESLCALFPATEQDDYGQKSSVLPADPVSDPQFVETIVDQLRKQKDIELERYRRQCERRAREFATAGSEMQDIYD